MSFFSFWMGNKNFNEPTFSAVLNLYFANLCSTLLFLLPQLIALLRPQSLQLYLHFFLLLLHPLRLHTGVRGVYASPRGNMMQHNRTYASVSTDSHRLSKYRNECTTTWLLGILYRNACLALNNTCFVLKALRRRLRTAAHIHLLVLFILYSATARKTH